MERLQNVADDGPKSSSGHGGFMNKRDDAAALRRKEDDYEVHGSQPY
jgi:hypothetical protein